jgi:hypothetical protein
VADSSLFFGIGLLVLYVTFVDGGASNEPAAS